jgi:energy-coupling factor transporter ATP-binding protein EcfA2
MASDASSSIDDHTALLASGGGNATAQGVTFQASVAAYFAAQSLAERPVEGRLGLAAVHASEFRFETEVPVDDTLVALDNGGWLFIQAKNGLTGSVSPESEYGKTCEEIVRLWKLTSASDHKADWCRPLSSEKDRIIIAVGPQSSSPIRQHLAKALDKLRGNSEARLSNQETEAIDKFRRHLAHFAALPVLEIDITHIDQICRLVHVVHYDFGGPHRETGETLMRSVLSDGSSEGAAFRTVEVECSLAMAASNGFAIEQLRSKLASGGLAVKGLSDYRNDISKLQARTTRVARKLKPHEQVHVRGQPITISRACVSAATDAARDGSLVLVGEPGSGKSAAINTTARLLIDDGEDVVLLAVDELPVDSQEGLSGMLGIDHPLHEVLENWPGADPGFLIIDALDSSRFAGGEALLRSLIHEVMQLTGRQWNVVASIRTFDLDVGQDMASLFNGVPPAEDFMDIHLQKVRHVRVAEWTEAEFSELMERAPDLKQAVDLGGSKLAELARVPFNTSLLAELLSAGTDPQEFKDMGSQIQLLDAYWNYRIRPLPVSAERCVATTVQAIINRGQMEVPRLEASDGTGDGLDHVLRSGMLTPAHGNRDVAFRHHLLFDYAASRTVIDLGDLPKLIALVSDFETALVLAPALSLALRSRWQWADQDGFWRIIAALAGDDDVNPVIQSVASRVASELPSEAADLSGFVDCVSSGEIDVATAEMTLAQVIGSLVVRSQDQEPLNAAPWCSLAAGMVPFVSGTAGPLRSVLITFIDTDLDVENLEKLGAVARALLEFAFDEPIGARYMPFAIEFVCKTFGTDPVASRELLERLLEPNRMTDHAADDMHWLARYVDRLFQFDPDLVVMIYDRVFSFELSENTKTRIGDSRILSLTSNSQQDFDMAKHGLAESFDAFVNQHPLEAARATIKVARGYASTKHGVDLDKRSLVENDQVAGAIIDDRSYIWAHNSSRQYADDAAKIVESFFDRLQEMPDPMADSIADLMISTNEMAWLWNRSLVVAKNRGGTLAEKLWPWSTRKELLSSSDTIKPSIDLLSSQYSQRPRGERLAFEADFLAAKFDLDRASGERTTYLHRRVLCAIGREGLVTEEAKAIVDQAELEGDQPQNVEPFRITDWEPSERQQYDWVREQGVDVSSPSNAAILSSVEGWKEMREANDACFGAKVDVLKNLHDVLGEQQASADPLVVELGLETLSEALNRSTETGSDLAEATDSAVQQCEEVLNYAAEALVSRDPVGGGEILSRAKVELAAAAMNLSRRSPEMASRLSDLVSAMATDGSFEVRFEVVKRVQYLWQTSPALMWQLVEGFVRDEESTRVLAALIQFLIKASNHDADRVTALTRQLIERDNLEDDGNENSLAEGLGVLVVHLWVTHSQPLARGWLDTWLDDRPNHSVELLGGIHTLRHRVVRGYDEPANFDLDARRRSQSLAYEIIDRSCEGLAEFIALEADKQSGSRQEAAQVDDHLISTMIAEFHYAIGPSDIRKGEEPTALREFAARQRFLDDNEPALRRVADVGTPRAVYDLIQLLDFLTPGNPKLAFDLMAHALLTAGRLHAYQHESLGSSLFVRMVGEFIADHRSIFSTAERRNSLIEIMQVFVKAGWPDARRLLYRLPDALK